MENEQIFAIVGYVLAILIPILGIILGLVLLFTKGDESEYLRKHSKYIIIVGVVMIVLSIILVMLFGISLLGIGMAMS
ncbi:DUF4870 domain-containing protein [uncultured Methanobrevibacter sp.]|uniref:DUF4870 domain-containing protein n=1 Tax=uncultured Methanobrevibacter sp. TaxID=253161 RepID=UPI0025ED7C2E|nr:DUF4870 domain-containing protein [uncultured Methanobrevibacter sp.]